MGVDDPKVNHHDRAPDPMREAIADGFGAYLANPEAANGVERAKGHAADERRRVRKILDRDRRDQARDDRRQEAIAEVEVGHFNALPDTALKPTPELLEKGEFRRVTVGREKQTSVTVETVRRVIPDRLIQLHGRGVLDDDQFAACVWYRRRWEETGLSAGPQTSKLAPTVRGDASRDHLPRTEFAWEAWHMYRYARDGVPVDVRALFEAVVLDGLTITQAARVSKCRFSNSSAAFRRGALELHDTIRHLLPIRVL